MTRAQDKKLELPSPPEALWAIPFKNPAPAPLAVNGRAAQNVLLSWGYKIGYITAARVLAVVLQHELKLVIWSLEHLDNSENNQHVTIHLWIKRKSMGIMTYSYKWSKAGHFSDALHILKEVLSASHNLQKEPSGNLPHLMKCFPILFHF